MTSSKIQVNNNNKNLNIQNHFDFLKIDTWNLFVIYSMTFGALYQTATIFYKN